jgi:hypothetical protein
MVMGDLNAKVGSNKGNNETMDQQGLGEMNENGPRGNSRILVPLTTLYSEEAFFQHKRMHKATWVSPDHTTENQIHMYV